MFAESSVSINTFYLKSPPHKCSFVYCRPTILTLTLTSIPDEVTHQATLTQPKVVVTVPECYDVIVNGFKDAKVDAKIVVIDNPNTPVPDGAIRYTELAEKSEADYGLLSKVVRHEDDTAVIPFSSGTTGLPKGVEISHKSMLASLEILGSERVCYPRIATGMLLK